MSNFLEDLTRRKSVTALQTDYNKDGHIQGTDLVRTLRLKDLVSFGIAAIIGAGILSTIGTMPVLPADRVYRCSLYLQPLPAGSLLYAMPSLPPPSRFRAVPIRTRMPPLASWSPGSLAGTC